MLLVPINRNVIGTLVKMRLIANFYRNIKSLSAFYYKVLILTDKGGYRGGGGQRGLFPPPLDFLSLKFF